MDPLARPSPGARTGGRTPAVRARTRPADHSPTTTSGAAGSTVAQADAKPEADSTGPAGSANTSPNSKAQLPPADIRVIEVGAVCTASQAKCGNGVPTGTTPTTTQTARARIRAAPTALAELAPAGRYEAAPGSPQPTPAAARSACATHRTPETPTTTASAPWHSPVSARTSRVCLASHTHPG